MFKRSHSPFLFTSAFSLLTALSSRALAQAPAVTPPEDGAAVGSSDPGVTPAPAVEAPAPLAFETELSTFVQPGALTSAEVAERALAKSPRLETKQAAVATAQAQADAVLGQFYPKLTGRASYTRLSNITIPPEFIPFFPIILDQYALTASLSIPVSDYILRLSTALSGASKNEESAKYNERAERLLLQTDAKVAYYTWVKAHGTLYVANQSKEQVDASLRDVKQAFAMGTASKADVLRTEAQVYSRELLQMRAKQAVDVATENLRTFMHDDGGKEYLVGEEILTEVEEPAVSSLEEGYNEAKSRRLELRALTSLEEATRDQATLAKVAYFPRLDLVGNATYANPNQRIFPLDATWNATWDAGIVLSWTPTDIPMARGEAASATSKATEIAAQRRQMEDGLRMEVASALSDMKTSLAAVKTSRQALESSEEGFRVRTELFKAGRATTLEVTDAQNALTQARLDLVFAHVDARIAKAKLLHTLGRDVTAEK